VHITDSTVASAMFLGQRWASSWTSQSAGPFGHSCFTAGAVAPDKIPGNKFVTGCPL